MNGEKPSNVTEEPKMETGAAAAVTNGGPATTAPAAPETNEPPSLDTLLLSVRALEAEVDKYRELELELAKHEDACQREFARIDKELRGRLKETQKLERASSKGRRASILSLGSTAAPSQPTQSPSELTRLIAMGTTIRHRLSLMRGTLPQPPGLLLKFSLGSPTPSHIRTHAARIAYKTSYETFKLRATIFSSVFALVNLMFPTVRVLDTIFMFCLLYYYSTLTLREHVLSSNGSRIRSWWLAHHILTAIMTGMLLIWPASSTSYHRFRPLFYTYAMYLGLVQYLQYKYQTARLYALRSLGQTNSMETIAGGEGSTVIGGREVEWLVPYLVGGWLWQGVCFWWGAKLWWDEEWDGGKHGPWQALGVGVMFLVLGIGNAWMTYITFREKAVNDKWRSRGRPAAPSTTRTSSPKPRSTSRGNTMASLQSTLTLPPPLDIPPFERKSGGGSPAGVGVGAATDSKKDE